MVKKYGPEPDNDKSHNASAVTNTDSTRERLVRFFEKYNKEKIDTVDKILVSYKGKEEQLFEALVKKYGPEPVISLEAHSESTIPLEVNSLPPGTNVPRSYRPDEVDIELIQKICREKGISMEKLFFSLFDSKEDAGTFLTRNFAFEQFEVRLRRMYHAYNYKAMYGFFHDLETYVTAKDQNDFLKGLFIKYGPEPVTMHEPRKFLIKPRKCMRADEDVLSDYEEEVKTPPNLPSKVCSIREFIQTVASDYPNDPKDSLAYYPESNEKWFRLNFISYRSAASNASSKTSPSVKFDRKSNSINVLTEDKPSQSQLLCEVRSIKDEFIQQLCFKCSNIVLSSFKALWAPLDTQSSVLSIHASNLQVFKTKLLKSKWKSRWVVLSSMSILYFKSNQHAQPINQIQFNKEVTLITKITDTKLLDEEPSANLDYIWGLQSDTHTT